MSTVWVWSQAEGLRFDDHLDTLHILRDYDPQFVTTDWQGENNTWNITNQFSAPFIRTSYVEENSSNQTPKAENFRIVNEYGQSRFFYRNGNRVQLIKSDFLQLTDLKIIEGDFVYTNPMTEYELNPVIDYSDVIEAQAAAIYEKGQMKTDLIRLFGIDYADRDQVYRVEATIQRKKSRPASGFMRYLFLEDDVVVEKNEESIQLLLSVRKGESWQSIGNPRTFTKSFYYFLPAHTDFFPLLIVVMDDYGKVSYADYHLTEQYKYLPKLTDPFKPLVKAYPNPTDKMYVKFEFNNMTPGLYRIETYNILGQQLDTRNFTLAGDDTYTMNVADYAQGTYLYRIIDPKGKVLFTRRFAVLEP